MNWYVTAGADPIGPVAEEQVVAMIRGGMRVTAVCRAGETTWSAPGDHPAFAAAFAPPPLPTQLRGGQSSEAIGVIALVIPLFSTALIWLWVGQMNLLQSPYSTLQMIGFLTVFATALLVSVEASQAGAGSATDRDIKGKPRSGPVVWFFATALLWFVGFPAWMFQRSVYGRKNMVVGGILVTIVFVASLLMMGAALDEQMRRVRGLFSPPGM